jgi:ribosomal protein L30/L7E
MNKQEQIKNALTGLAKLQIALDKKGGPSEDGELFEEILTLQERILSSFGLPSTTDNLKLVWFNGSVPTPLELVERVKQLNQKAKEYLLSPVKPETQILRDAQENKASAFSTLPELGITTHSYTIFVYEKILLAKRDKIENILEELRRANQPRTLHILENLSEGNVEKPDEVIEVLKHLGLKYIDDFVKTFPKKNTRKEANQLFEFWNDINGGFDFKSLDDRFEAHTHYMMNYLCLVVGDQPYRITECEVYYYDSENHPDPYVHKRNQQLFAGNWYFNDMGIDLTFGNYDKKIYASILIRGIRNMQTNQYISGTSNVLREIFDKFGNIMQGDKGLCLREINQGVIREEEPTQSTRIGLAKKAEDTQDFIGKKYRYIVELTLAHKFKDKEKVVKQLLSENKISNEEAKNIIGYNVKL